MFGVILKATNSSFQKGMTLCCSVYVKKVMKLLAFIFEQPSYVLYVAFLFWPSIFRPLVVSADVRYRVLILLFIHCLMLPPLWGLGLCTGPLL